MDWVIEYLLVFCFCASAGWCLEVLYRSVKHRKVVNPGFLTGCCLPIYGVGGCVLYALCSLPLRALPNEVFRMAAILVLAILIMTGIELFSGWAAVTLFQVRLWDYSGEWMNFKGLICPKFSLLWGVVCAAYAFGLYPFLHPLAAGAVEQPGLVLAIGAYLGVFAVDLGHSLRLLQRVRAYALHMRTLVDIDQLKANARAYAREQTGGRRAPFTFYHMVNRYLSDLHGYRDDIRRKWGGGSGK